MQKIKSRKRPIQYNAIAESVDQLADKLTVQKRGRDAANRILSLVATPHDADGDGDGDDKDET